MSLLLLKFCLGALFSVKPEEETLSLTAKSVDIVCPKEIFIGRMLKKSFFLGSLPHFQVNCMIYIFFNIVHTEY